MMAAPPSVTASAAAAWVRSTTTAPFDVPLRVIVELGFTVAVIRTTAVVVVSVELASLSSTPSPLASLTVVVDMTVIRLSPVKSVVAAVKSPLVAPVARAVAALD